MKRQVLQRDRLTGRAVVTYVDHGPAKAEPGHGRSTTTAGNPTPGTSARLASGGPISRIGGTS